MTIWDRLTSEIVTRGFTEADAADILSFIDSQHPSLPWNDSITKSVGIYALLYQEMLIEVHKRKSNDRPI